MKTVLTIAGSDCSGGAGIQADIKTVSAHGLYAMSAVTALTAQNTMGVSAVEPVSAGFLSRQLACIFEDIHPDAVKIGMMVNKELVEAAADSLIFYQAENIVIDTVMMSTSGKTLLDEPAREVMTKRLLPLATVITPNIPEAEVLSGRTIRDAGDMIKSAQIISARLGGKTAVLIKGGHRADTADDLLYMGRSESAGRIQDKTYLWFAGPCIDNPNTHGTGCTLSSAIAANLAMGRLLPESVRNAKDYITGAIASGLNLGRGRGPLNHMYRLADYRE